MILRTPRAIEGVESLGGITCNWPRGHQCVGADTPHLNGNHRPRYSPLMVVICTERLPPHPPAPCRKAVAWAALRRGRGTPEPPAWRGAPAPTAGARGAPLPPGAPKARGPSPGCSPAPPIYSGQGTQGDAGVVLPHGLAHQSAHRLNIPQFTCSGEELAPR